MQLGKLLGGREVDGKVVSLDAYRKQKQREQNVADLAEYLLATSSILVSPEDALETALILYDAGMEESE